MVSDFNLSQFMIAGTNSGSGKTTLTLGILRALSRRALRVAPFKCGPDYIDPLFHRQAAGQISFNLDSFLQAQSAYGSHLDHADVAVVEGVMGLFDGISPGSMEGSCAELAINLKLPVILTVNARGMSGSIAPLVKGFCQWHENVHIIGVIANQVGSIRHAGLLKEALAAAALPPLLGFLIRDERWVLPERHLGLTVGALEEQWLDQLADAIGESVDLDEILRLTRAAVTPEPPPVYPAAHLRLGVARDEAFCFYYEANLDALRRHGVEIVPFSPLHDTELPPQLDGIYLGGGYPELYLEALTANSSMRQAMQTFSRTHLIYGECGGYLYLLDSIRDFSGRTYPGLGLLPGQARMNRKLSALGYRSVSGAWGRLRGHEFHYSSLEASPEAPFLWQIEDVHGNKSAGGGTRGRVKGSYIHLYFDSDPSFVRKFCQELQS